MRVCGGVLLIPEVPLPFRRTNSSPSIEEEAGRGFRPTQLMIATRLKLLVRNKPLTGFIIVIKHPLTACVSSYFSFNQGDAHSSASKHFILSSDCSTDDVPSRCFSPCTRVSLIPSLTSPDAVGQ